MSNVLELANMEEMTGGIRTVSDKTMKDLQAEVDEYIGQFKEGYFSPLAMMAVSRKNWANLQEKSTIIMGKSRRKRRKMRKAWKRKWAMCCSS